MRHLTVRHCGTRRFGQPGDGNVTGLPAGAMLASFCAHGSNLQKSIS